MMNLIDQKVTHKRFGTGSIVKFSGNIIEINFATENKMFVYPDVFKDHLKLQNSKEAKMINGIIEQKELERKEEEKNKEEQAQLERQKLLLHWEHERLMKHHKLHVESQLVFWCDEEEQTSAFEDWKVFSGVTKSGNNKGKANKPIRLHQNSAILLTARNSKESENDRRILGFYMVGEEFIGKLCEDGEIPAHAKYKLQLTEEESNALPFWKYYVNAKTPEKISWNTGKYRYFDNLWMAQILVDIVALKTDPAEKEFAQQFLKHFCKMNKLTVQDLVQPTGALTKI